VASNDEFDRHDYRPPDAGPDDLEPGLGEDAPDIEGPTVYHSREGVIESLVERGDETHRRRRGGDDADPAPWREHATYLAEHDRPVVPREQFEREAHKDGVEPVDPERQLQSIATDDRGRDVVIDPISRATTHPLCNVDTHDPAAGSNGVLQRSDPATGPTADVEDSIVGRHAETVDSLPSETTLDGIDEGIVVPTERVVPRFAVPCPSRPFPRQRSVHSSDPSEIRRKR